ncbi:hypothetical protein, partial [Rhodopseudomonas sp. B29]|uniref:hypothetical protein n=1 Tax=Rhodopseudomonas sp. B29 TaxID=95607 RepID=UPI000593A160
MIADPGFTSDAEDMAVDLFVWRRDHREDSGQTEPRVPGRLPTETSVRRVVINVDDPANEEPPEFGCVQDGVRFGVVVS